MSIIVKQDTNGVKPLLQVGELGYDNFPTGGDAGRVYVGTGTENIAQAKRSEVTAVDSKVDTHVARVDNPHGVTKAQVGLGNVDNTSDVSKNVLSATKLTTPRNITISGEVAGSASFDGSTNINISTTIQPNSVTLGTDTTGNYTSGVTAGAGITVTGTAGEGWSPTVAISPVGTVGTYTKVTTNDKGQVVTGTILAASDIPSLDASKITSGIIDAARLPAYVDDVLEYATLSGFPITGETGKIYVALDTNKAYRWSGSTYIYITSGAVDSVAGKTGAVILVRADVGLTNVDNTSDINKPISTATQNALNLKVDKVAGKQLSTEDYTTAEKTKLSELNNYIKPISEPISYINGLQTTLDDKVDKVGKQALDSNNALRINGTTVSLYKGDGTFDSITTQDTIYIHPNSGVTAGTYSKVTVDTQGHITDGSSLLESDIPSLDASKITSGTIDSARLPSFVDDVLEFVNLAGFPTTGEAGKIYIALDTNKTYRWSGSTYVYITSGAVDSVAGKTGVVTLVKSDVGLNNVDNTSDANKPVSTATQTALDTKVDKIAGKQLSTEDYTTADKNKLTSLSNYTKPASEPISYITGLQTALDSKVNKNGVEALHSTDALRISGTTLSLYKGDGTFESVVTQDTVYTLPNASATVLGGIKVGTNLSIDANGVLSANDTNVGFAEISDKPTNLSGYGITDAYTKTQVDTIVGDIASALDTINGQVI